MESKWYVRSCSSISRLERWRARHALSVYPSFTDPTLISGQSHLIFGTGSISSVMTSQLSKLCCTNVLYKALENLDAIALDVSQKRLDSEALKHYNRLWKHRNASPSRCSSVVEQRFCKPPMLGELSRNTTGVV